MKKNLKIFLGLIVILLLYGPGAWTILVILCEMLNILSEFVDFYDNFFDGWNNKFEMIYLMISTLLVIITILFWVYLIVSELIYKYKKNKKK